MSKDIEHISSRIGQRDWKDILVMWQEFIPRIEFPITANPLLTSEITSLEVAKEDITRIETSSTIKDHHFVIPGLHPLIFLEAVYLFYKSLNVLKSTQCDIISGFKTWSVANAYQSSYFGLKCFLDIIGIHSARVVNKDLLVDLYPSYRSLKRKEVDRRRKDFEVQIQIMKQLDHWEYWVIFQRVLRTTKNLSLEEPLIRFFHSPSLDPLVFARQRNKVIYSNNQWLFEDLKEVLVDPDFGIKRVISLDDVDYSTEDDSFTTINAYLLLRLNYALLRNIADNNPNFRQEFTIMISCIENNNNALFQRFMELQS